MSALPTSGDPQLQHRQKQCPQYLVKHMLSRTMTWNLKTMVHMITKHVGPCSRRERHRYHRTRQWQRQEEQGEETIGDQHGGLRADAIQATRHRHRHRHQQAKDHDPHGEAEAKTTRPLHQKNQLENKS